MRFSLTCIAAFLCASSADAGPREQPYAHKAGVSAETFDSEQNECLASAAKARDIESKKPDALAQGRKSGFIYVQTYVTCMEGKGYTHRAKPIAEAKAIRKLPKEQQVAGFRRMVSAPVPVHPEYRGFDPFRQK